MENFPYKNIDIDIVNEKFIVNNKNLNYTQGFDHLRLDTNIEKVSLNLVAANPIIKKGIIPRTLPNHICLKLYRKTVDKKVKNAFYEVRNVLYDTNPMEKTNYLYKCFFYESNFLERKSGKFKDHIDHKDILPEEYGFDYLKENHQRIYLITNMLNQARLNIYINDEPSLSKYVPILKKEISKIENVNFDFLINTKWAITPAVFSVAATNELPLNKRRSEIIAYCYAKPENREEVLKCDIEKTKKVYQKEYQVKIDLRKSVDIKKLVRHIEKCKTKQLKDI